MENGWIKIHRKLVKKGFYQKSQYVHLWVHLLLTANHEPSEFMWNDKTIIVKEGQLITGRKKLMELTGIPETTVERILDFLEKEGQIGQQKTTKFRLITIINWKTHQKSDNRRTTDGQQTDTNKNLRIKELKNNTNTIAANSPQIFSLKDEIKKLEDNPRRDLNIIALYLEKRKPNIKTKEQYAVALRRHLRPAKTLVVFDDNQILKACETAEKEYPKIWTLETIVKLLTK